tara:strand:+ start:3245 stop:4225 length:981 start_codon:yes stop_codon:yes gene_type:complete
MRIGIYSPNWIGDSVLAIPFIQLIKAKEQDAEIIIICKDWVSGVYANHPAVNEIIPFSDTQLSGFFNLLRSGRKLKRYKFDIFYTLTDSFRSAFLLWLSGARKRVGYSAQMRFAFLTDVKSLARKPVHRSEKYMNLISENFMTSSSPEIHITKSESSWAKKEIKKLKLNYPVALFPFSVADNRNISIDRLIQWIKETNNEYLVFGSKNEIEKGEKFINDSQSVSIKSICGKYTLRESIAIISICNYTLATDSGLGHISAALGLPTISFFGAGFDTITSPIGKNTKIIKHCSPCLGELCENLDSSRRCIQKISKFDIENAVNSITNQ